VGPKVSESHILPDPSLVVDDPDSEGSVLVRELSWGQELVPSVINLSFPFFDRLLQDDPLIGRRIPKFDLIMATDCIYRQELFEPFLDALIRVSSLPYNAPEAGSDQTKLLFTPLGLIVNVKSRKIEKRFWKRMGKFFVVHLVKEYQVFDHEEGGMKPMRIFSATLKN